MTIWGLLEIDLPMWSRYDTAVPRTWQSCRALVRLVAPQCSPQTLTFGRQVSRAPCAGFGEVVWARRL